MSLNNQQDGVNKQAASLALGTSPKQGATLQDWLDYLLSIHPAEIDMGLTRVSQVAKQLQLLDLAPAQVITVAGTNGKGTSCAMLESVLSFAGKRVGVYSSPHLIHYNERVRIQGVDASDEALIAAFSAIEAARGAISLTFFEYATLAGLWLFKAAKLDVIILEVGLGGRLDATNMIDADICLLTSIALDHQEYLGDTREAVGREKAGVFRANRLAVIGEPALPITVTDYAKQIGAPVCRVGHEFSYETQGNTWSFNSQHRQIAALALPVLPLANAASVVALLTQHWPEISDEQLSLGIGQARLAGRFETLSTSPLVIVDVAHNPHAAAYLAKQLSVFSSKRILALCGMLKDKDMAGVLSELTDVVDGWYFVSLQNERGASASQLSAALGQTQTQALEVNLALTQVLEFESLSQGWHALTLEAQEDDIIIVFGSFYTVAGIKALLEPLA
jgi:dihydrofolate synthase / folylpolyglutamate synthase